MLEKKEIITTTERLAAVLHVTVDRAKIQEVMGPGLQEVMAAVKAQGIEQAGPWFTHHLRMDPKVFDFEICVPVARAVKPAGRVTPSRVPARRAARAVYRGGYEGLGGAWGEFDAWTRSQGHVPAAELWECYLSGPESGSDPSQWTTELTRPLAS
jgi:effector-binding domain-containing protein